MKIPYISPGTELKKVTEKLNRLERIPVSTINWKEFTYAPKVEFAILWSETGLFINYWVDEEVTMALTLNDNGPVWKDSCVEFFVSPDGNDFYYNFEFNCIGSCLLAFGENRNSRRKASDEILKGIARFSSLEKKVLPESHTGPWDLLVIIPPTAFFMHPGFKFREMTMKGNFYKCGDGLSKPHYLTWKPISTEKPDYHRPEFFSSLELQK
jgi:hypothetical protein